ncbi:MAG: 2-oxo acid dehydrogenase subunit E2 [Planctomycetaceae bacterium]|nr:2-oxo acid dehydrogenase subunit E2 [Planctomycetaceae bacterium]
MSIEFKLPSIGEGVESADVAEIHVKPGDRIEANQVVAELETEKAVVELPCPHAGTIQELRIKSGDTIKVGDVVLTIDAAGNGAVPAANAKPAAAPAKPEPAAKPPAESLAVPAPTKAAVAPGGGAAQRIEFQLPALGEGIETADVAEIHVKAGDTIAAEQVVMDLETEKAVIELPCPFAGTIESLHVSTGSTVKIGQNLFTLATTGTAAPAPSAKPAPQTTPAAKPPAATPAPKSEPPARPLAALQPAAVSRAPSAPPRDGSPIPASPSTRRLARQLGVELRDVTGSGPGGRITHEDVRDYVKSRLQASNLPAVRAPQQSAMMSGSLAPPPLPDFSRFGAITREKLNKIGRTAAENLTVSWNVIPHVTQHDRADITDLEAARKRFGTGPGQKGPKVTMTAIAIKALATLLQAFPKFNSSLDPETFEIVFKQYYNIGCAVDTPNGLMVPVVHGADRKSILEIAAELGDLAEKARDRKLPIDSMQGATCTVTNLGGIGGTSFTPIVNYPEVCILGMSRSQSELKLVDGKPVERLLLPLSLSYDHRVINGADAARFLAALCNMLSDPFQLLSAI